MSALPPISPQQFFLELFGSQAARGGAIVRRKVRDVERYIGREAFLSEAKRRGFPVVENAGQFVIFCNNEPIRRLL
ncbi:MAG: N-(5'-phosphoribosyl)anthranilate isomerase [Pseudomonadota bacterium]